MHAGHWNKLQREDLKRHRPSFPEADSLKWAQIAAAWREVGVGSSAVPSVLIVQSPDDRSLCLGLSSFSMPRDPHLLLHHCCQLSFLLLNSVLTDHAL